MTEWRQIGRLVVLLLTLALGFAYPVLIHFSLIRFSVLETSVFILLLVVLRMILLGKNYEGPGSTFTPLLAITGLSALLALLMDSDIALKLTPALVNMALLLYFASTFFGPMTFVERVARKQRGEPFPGQAISYCKKVNLIWCLFFLCSSLILGFSAFYLSRNTWAWVSGVGYWVALAALFIFEWLFRTIFKEPVFHAEQLLAASHEHDRVKNFSTGKDGEQYVA